VRGPGGPPETGGGENPPDAGGTPAPAERVPLSTVAREWGRIGCTGFGGPPAHISLLRRLCVEQRGWISEGEFEHAISATNLLPGPASTQLAIYCAWRVRSTAGGLVGGACFIVPGLILILGLSALFLQTHPPTWVLGAAAGLGAAVPAVALSAAAGLFPASWRGVGNGLTGGLTAARARWLVYAAAGATAAATLGPWLVAVLLGCGAVELAARRAGPNPGRARAVLPLAVPAVATGGLLALAWVAFKVGALSFGGGFVIIPLMQADAVHHYHWMTGSQFLNAVALGQITPGPVVQTVSVVGYAAAGLGGGLLAAFVAFSPSFVFVLVGGRYFDRLRHNRGAMAFLRGSGPAAVGAIAGAAVPLARELSHVWQVPVLVAAAVWLLVLRRGVVIALLGAGLVGLVGALLGLPVGR